jgi:hypothetical protein
MLKEGVMLNDLLRGLEGEREAIAQERRKGKTPGEEV